MSVYGVEDLNVGVLGGAIVGIVILSFFVWGFLRGDKGGLKSKTKESYVAGERVVLRIFFNLVEAQGFKAFMVNLEIDTTISGDNDSAGLGITSIASGGIKIWVPKAQLAAAQLASEEYDVLMTKE